MPRTTYALQRERRLDREQKFPKSSPTLDVPRIASGSHTVVFTDSIRPTSEVPAGADGLELFIAIGENAAYDPERARYYGTYDRNGIEVAFDGRQDGLIATYYGRWGGLNGQAGPWSLPVTKRIVV